MPVTAAGLHTIRGRAHRSLSRMTATPLELHTFYDGRPQAAEAAAAATFESTDPATGALLATVHPTSAAALDAAVASASKAFPVWAATPGPQRAKVLLRAAALLRERNDELALVETHDTGKALCETSTVDIATGADVLEYYAHMAAGGLPGRRVQLRPDAYVLTSREPLGVCAGIGAWNYPIQIALWKSAACLAAGNAMVYKPSEVTPLHAQRLAEIYVEAGVPPGTFNVVYGAGDVGARLVAHAGIAKVSFTGQVSTGSKVASEAARGMKGITMELGGKSPLVVLPDADAGEAADVAMAANFYSSGQVCTNGTRVFVPDTLLPAVEAALVDRCRSRIRMGLPTAKDTNFGPVVSAAQHKKVNEYIAHGTTVDGARVLYNGAHDAQKALPTKNGFWVPPVIFSDCTDNMKVVREEIFGPVMCILPYKAAGRPQHEWMRDVVDRANDTQMGLAAGVVSSDVGLAQEVVHKLEAGITWINTWGESPPEMPVGGWRLSGFGVENGEEGIQAYLRVKSTLVQLGKGATAETFAKL